MNMPTDSIETKRDTNTIPNSQEYRIPNGPTGSWLPTLKLIRDPRSALEGWVKQYGDPFLLNALNGPIVVTARQDLLRIIHGQDPDIYAPFAMATIVPMLGTGSMLILEGEAHRRERRLMTPMFHGDRMKAYGSTMQTIALEQLESHRKRGTIVTLDMMTDISLEAIVRTIFGGSDRESAMRLMDVSRQMVAKSHPVLFFSRRTHISLWGWSPWDRFLAARTKLFDLVNDIIDRRQSSPELGDDILALLCSSKYDDGDSITREHLQGELMTFLFAGHETTALSLTWAIYHLHRNPTTLEKLRDELNALSDNSPSTLASAPYLKAVVQETLRIHPIVTETLRKLKRPMQLGDYYLPAGMGIAPATVLAHHNPITYPDPEQFRPERFIERSYSPFEYMPFGGGHRRCIGAAFASYEMAMVLGTLIKHFRFELVDSAPVVPKRRNVTIGPSTGVPIRVVS